MARLPLLASLLLTLALLPGLAEAAGPTPLGPPTRLAPPQKLTIPPQSDAPADEGQPVVPAAPNSPAIPNPAAPNLGGAPNNPAAAPKGIQVDNLAPIDPDWAGPLGPERGGFPVQTMWRGTPRTFVAALVPRIPITNSPALQDLTRRLLLSNAVAPAGTLPPDAPSLVGLRLERLVAAGQPAAAKALLDQTPNRAANEALERRSVELAFLDGSTKEACGRVGDDVKRFNEIWWQRALIACQALAGDHAKAALGLDLLREQKAPKDETFDRLVEAAGGAKVKIEKLPDPAPLDLALLAGSKQPIPADTLASASPAALRTLSAAGGLSPAQRVAAAERSAALGALPLDDLRKQYETIDASAEERANPISAAQKAKGARGHALLYAAAHGQKLPAARIELLRALLDGGRKEGDFVFLARLVEPLVADLQPVPELASFAPDAARVLIAAGRADDAKPWIAATDPDTARSLYPLSRLALGGKGPGYDSKAMSAAIEAMAKGEGDAAPRKAALALALLGAFDDPVGPAEWAPLAAKLPPLVSLDLPGAPVWFDLPKAAQGKRLGETILLALITAGEGDKLSPQPARLLRAIEALRAVGLEIEARNLALEAALAGGL